mgnify:CR=1 FL=1
MRVNRMALRLKADKRSLLAVGSPHAYARSTELNAYLSLTRNRRKDVDGMYLALVEDDGVVLGQLETLTVQAVDPGILSGATGMTSGILTCSVRTICIAPVTGLIAIFLFSAQR